MTTSILQTREFDLKIKKIMLILQPDSHCAALRRPQKAPEDLAQHVEFSSGLYKVHGSALKMATQ
jgi:hypothetical protein